MYKYQALVVGDEPQVVSLESGHQVGPSVQDIEGKRTCGGSFLDRWMKVQPEDKNRPWGSLDSRNKIEFNQLTRHTQTEISRCQGDQLNSKRLIHKGAPSSNIIA